MFNVKVLNDAIVSLSDEGKAEIQKMVDIFEQYKSEVERLEEVAEGFEQLSKQLQKDKENLEATVASQAEKITQLTEGTTVIKPKEEFLNSHEL
jgi:DNA-binding PadR family transcriptional regulator